MSIGLAVQSGREARTTLKDCRTHKKPEDRSCSASEVVMRLTTISFVGGNLDSFPTLSLNPMSVRVPRLISHCPETLEGAILA